MKKSRLNCLDCLIDYLECYFGQEVYGSDSQLAYTLRWEYDNLGNLTSHTDALGQVHKKMYDANCNLIKEFSPRGDHWKEYTYDLCNRLKEVKEMNTNGEVYVAKNAYDVMGLKRQFTDSFGNNTLYTYDELGRVVKTTLPKKIELYKTYDTMGHVTSEKDGLGNVTKTKCNIYGKPLHILYPDGTEEHFEYNINGTLKKSVSKNGSYQIYTYDYQNRLLEQSKFSSTGQELFSLKNSYNAFHLLTTQDNAGHITTYTYDAAGRKKSESKGTSHIEYVYDALGRLEKTLEWYGEKDVKVTVTIYDFLNRLIEERVEDAQGRLLKQIRYAYDADNNRTHIFEGPIPTETAYDLFKRPILITDPLGNQTAIHYDHGYKNSLGKFVLQRTKIDPLGNSTIITYDTHNKGVLTIKKNSLGTILSKRECTYDLQTTLQKWSIQS